MRRFAVSSSLSLVVLLCATGCGSDRRPETGIGRVSADLALDSMLLDLGRVTMCAFGEIPPEHRAEDYQAACTLLTRAVEVATPTWHLVDSLGALPDSLFAYDLIVRLEIPEEDKSRLDETTVGPFLRPALCDSLEAAARAANFATRRCRPWAGFFRSLRDTVAQRGRRG